MAKSLLNKKIVVMGAGAIGSFYGGMAAKAGYNVTLFTRGKHLEALQLRGSLIIDSLSLGKHEVAVKSTNTLTEEYDIAVISCKTHDTAEICGQLKGHLAEDGYIISIQNGVENTGIISSFFDKDKIIGCSAFVGLWIDPAGTVNHSAHGDLVLGGITEKAKAYENELVEIFTNSDIKASAAEDIKYVQWKKLIWNVAYNPLSALLDSRCGKMRLDESIAELMDKMVLETVEAASIDGITIKEEVWQDLIAHRESLNSYETSMLQDIHKNRKPEVDGILGPVVRTLEKAGKSAPYCETVLRTLKFKFEGWFQYSPKLAADVIVINDESILLIERKNEPFGWAIPGGFVDYGERVEDAATRELFEETGIKADKIELLGVYSDPERDSRGHTVSPVYYTFSDQRPKAADDAKDAKFFKINNLPDLIAFDHRKIISDLAKKLNL